MPNYALLGATGSTGSGVLRCLLSEAPPDLKLNILVRSKSKLLQAFPQLEQTKTIQIRIFEGSSTDPIVLEPCLEDAAVIFVCVGQNESKRGSTLCTDTAAAILTTLTNLRKIQGNSYQTPSILQLRSASLNPALASQVPSVIHKLVSFCLHYNYNDIKRACSRYESAAAAEDPLLNYVFIDPPTIHDAAGTLRTGYRLITTEKQATALSYADLGAAMCEIAQRRVEFRNRAVGVTATGKVRATWNVLAGYLVGGAKNRVMGWVAGAEMDVFWLYLKCGI